LSSAEHNSIVLYHLAEVSRLAKCDFLKTLPSKVESLLENNGNKLTDANTIYFAHLLGENAKAYGVKASSVEKF
jgi:hypothetical protein